jgi:hypothetical protein
MTVRSGNTSLVDDVPRPVAPMIREVVSIDLGNSSAVLCGSRQFGILEVSNQPSHSTGHGETVADRYQSTVDLILGNIATTLHGLVPVCVTKR